MRISLLILSALAMTFGAAAPGWSSTPSNVLVVFNGQTEVNRETYNFLKRNLGTAAPEVNLTATQDLKSVKPGAYKAVLVLSSGRSDGLDPVLKAFVDSYPAKDRLFVVSLLAGSPSVKVQTFQVPTAGQPVDAVAAASKWSEGSDKMTYIRLHQEWVQDFVRFLAKETK